MNLSLPFADPPFADPPCADPPAVTLPAAVPQASAASRHQDAALSLALQDDALAPGQIHPALWRANQIGAAAASVSPSGFAALDAQLPGGGWPHGTLTELLLGQPGIGELRLLAPALTPVATPGPARPGSGGGRSQAAAAEAERCVMLFDPPAALNAWALWQRGLSPGSWLVVQGRAAMRQPRSAQGLLPLLPSADVLWALEQALRSGHVSAVLAWLPLNLRADTLRRLQLAAQHCAGPVFIFRDAQARARPSAAPLRLLLQPAGVDGLSLRLLKRRGPPLAQALRLALPPVLAPQQQARAEARLALRDAAEQAARRPAGPGAGWSGNLPGDLHRRPPPHPPHPHPHRLQLPL